MTTSDTTKVQKSSLLREAAHAAQYYLCNRRAVVIISIVAIAGGVAMNWGWLVAAGVAPVLLTALPCLVMCGLGLCMHKMVGGSCASQPSQSDKTELTQSSSSAEGSAKASNPLAGISSCCGVSADASASTDRQKTRVQGLEEPHA